MAQAHPEGIVGGPFPGAILLMTGDQGTQVWVSEPRTRCVILFNDGAVGRGLMVLEKPQPMEFDHAEKQIQGDGETETKGGDAKADA